MNHIPLKLRLPDFNLFPKCKQLPDDDRYFHLDIFSSHPIITEISMWPLEYKQNITLILNVAQYIVRGGGKKHAFTIPTYKIFVKRMNPLCAAKELVCIVKAEYVLWQSYTDDVKQQFNESDEITKTIMKLFEEANDNGTTET